MLTESNFIPKNKHTLELILNGKDGASYNLSINFPHFKEWIMEVLNSDNAFTKKELLSLLNKIYEFYLELKEYVIDKSFSQDILAKLKPIIDCYFIDAFKEVTYNEIIDVLEIGMCLHHKENYQFELKPEITMDTIQKLYFQYLKMTFKFYDFLHEVEKRLVDLHKKGWEENVFYPKVGFKLPEKSKHLVQLGNSSDIIISFCEHLDKYVYTSQKMISASLHNTVSRRTYSDRSYGFMYSFNPDSIIAMSYDDAESCTLTIQNEVSLVAYLLQGTPADSLIKSYHINPINLKPLYDFSEFKKKTMKYNEILLREGTVPFGIFIFQEATTESFITAATACISNSLPLFVCREDGSLDYFTSKDIFKHLCERGNLYKELYSILN